MEAALLRYAVTVCVQMGLLIIAASCGAFKPVPPIQVKPAVSAWPTLPAHSNWGDVTVQGAQVRISGHPYWGAEGKWIRTAAGPVLLLWWYPHASQREAPSRYIVREGRVVGVWGWHDEGVCLDELSGEITGAPHTDEIRETPKPAPDGH